MADKIPIPTYMARGAVAGALLLASTFMFLAKQKVDVTSREIIEYKNWKSFSVNAGVDIGVLVYSICTLFLRRGWKIWRGVAVADVVLMMLLGASISAAWDTYALLNGEWDIALLKGGCHCCSSICKLVPQVPSSCCSSICRQVPYFCGKILTSLIACSIGTFFHMLLMMWSLYFVYDPLG